MKPVPVAQASRALVPSMSAKLPSFPEGIECGFSFRRLLDHVSDGIPLAFRLTRGANLIGWQGTLPHAGFRTVTCWNLTGGIDPARPDR
jgi:hypothetical protein